VLRHYSGDLEWLQNREWVDQESKRQIIDDKRESWV
jgi:hypothetical protein